MNPPNLAGVVDKSDVFSKGTGSYAASYISWARIAHYLHEHAPGWQFCLKPTVDGLHVWTAPDGSGYVIGYFRGPDGELTSDFPFPVMDHRNNPVPVDKVSCRALTDTHRRALCATAAFSFGLGYELWAKAEIEEAKAEPAASAPEAATATQPSRNGKSPAKPRAVTAATPEPEPTPEPDPDLLTAEAKTDLIRIVSAASPDVRSRAVATFQEHFNLPSGQKIADHIRTHEHLTVLMEALNNAEAQLAVA